MKYNMMTRVYGWAFDKVMKDYYVAHDVAFNAKEIRQRTLKEYRAIIERTPGVGKSPLASALMGACYFVALIKTIPDMTAMLDDMFLAVFVINDQGIFTCKKAGNVV